MSISGQRFVVAVSGGVDSVSLLNMLVSKELAGFENGEIIVAHFDHGIREDSKEDRIFVEVLAKKYGLKFVYEEGELGVGCSEAKARAMRYNFLRQCCKNNNASSILTAHHQDDLIETAIINILRGTNWRGLSSMTQISTDNFQIANNNQTANSRGCHFEIDSRFSEDMDYRLRRADELVVLRPLLKKTKQEIIEYAKARHLEWREDSTNTDNQYLRNYVRNIIIPRAVQVDPTFNKKMLKHIEAAQKLRCEIELEIADLTNKYRQPNNTYQIPRHQLIMWPANVAKEFIYNVLTTLDADWDPTSVQIRRVIHFAKTIQIGKTMEVSKRLKVVAGKSEVTFQRTG